MRFFALLMAVTVGMVYAGPDMEINFPGAIIPRQVATNLMTFTGALGGISAPAITSSGNSQRPYSVEGSTFPDFVSAFRRACDIQKNDCADFANGKGKGTVEVVECESQLKSCESAATTETNTAFATFYTSDANFDYYCES